VTNFFSNRTNQLASEMKWEELTISLDIDGLLIYAEEADEKVSYMRPPDFHVKDKDGDCFVVWIRPHTFDLLQQCFVHCRGVGFFTNASRSYAEAVIGRLLGGKTWPAPIFLLTHENCTQIYERDGLYSSPMATPNKKLAKIFRRPRIRQMGITRHNTLHIDDNLTFRSNYGNGILVKSWEGDFGEDRWLQWLVHYLDIVICQEDVTSVRTIEKRGWVRKVLS
jgi:hypothetical protein